MPKKIYLSPAAHKANNPCGYSKSCGENIHCNTYMDYLEPMLVRCGFEVKRNPKPPVGQTGMTAAINASNAWGADLHYVAHTNAGGGTYSLLMYKSAAEQKLADIIRTHRAKIYPWSIKVQSNRELAELVSTKADAVYDELTFHDNFETVKWLHSNFKLLAENTAQAICEMFGCAWFAEGGEKPAPTPAPSKSIDDIAKEVIGGKWGNGDERKKRLSGAGYDAIAVQKRVNEMLAGTAPAPAPKPLVVGCKVQYSGRLYASSTGDNPGKTVSGTYTVTRIIDGRSHGVLLNNGLGWVAKGDCKVI